MENFEGGSSNPEIKDKIKLNWKQRLGLVAAAALGTINPLDMPVSKPVFPNETSYKSPEPPKPDIG